MARLEVGSNFTAGILFQTLLHVACTARQKAGFCFKIAAHHPSYSPFVQNSSHCAPLFLHWISATVEDHEDHPRVADLVATHNVD